ncbi:MAG: 4Fe-4S binding protein [Campylobacteraceae bacterium]|jgi:ferredoxin|nr:4Fe-4S binding protein [Campylobacteraceae bacterium]
MFEYEVIYNWGINKLVWFPGLCTKCGSCASVCDTGALEFTGNLTIIKSLCVGCSSCVGMGICSPDALRIIYTV